ncbi:MAG TPA: bifunctional riboflavin kinase/FAD synthetase [Bacteroidetes bacterium]|nr:riboflavin biosynthesis protein RibF [bacterium BMS3Bbin04]HDO64790.1 bifunctional riboflavin kinase/FAD synthetase [Bacteroidota bacterium]HEX03915.1 bifunctional riboflavin kinase/FAD synthetase [Bacteroidota bacterium]
MIVTDMEVYRYGQETIPRIADATVTIGIFDGVHLGHHHLLNEVLKGPHPTVVTFDPHPRHVLTKGLQRLKILTPVEEKLRKLAELGIERTIIIPFNRDVADLNAESFLRDILVNSVGMATLVVGFNHSFGRNREGNIDFMRAHEKVYGYKLIVMEAHEQDALAVSSTRIRSSLETGKLDDATRFLGDNYRTKAKVVSGEGRGRDLGYPTANLEFFDCDQLQPAEGVYAVRVRLDNQSWLNGVASIGRKETFGDYYDVTVEVHIFDQKLDLYDQVVWVEWIEFLREQKAFGSVEDLIDQMDEDSRRARMILKNLEGSTKT